jgi:catechol-2,3-dioxygenase
MEMPAPTDGFAELTLETEDLAGLDRLRDALTARGAAVRGPQEHEGGDRSIYVEDPEGNIVEVWDFFARRPIEELAE